jgi:hypothetical protein
MLNELAGLTFKLGDSLRLDLQLPGYPRGGLNQTYVSRTMVRITVAPCPLAPPEEFSVRAPVHQTQHHHPARVWAGRHHVPGGRRRASRRLYSVHTPRGWLGPARGEFLAPNSPLGPPPVLLADFWATGRARNPLDFARWVVPIKARGRYTLCSAIHRAEGVRRVRNGDLWKCV